MTAAEISPRADPIAPRNSPLTLWQVHFPFAPSPSLRVQFPLSAH